MMNLLGLMISLFTLPAFAVLTAPGSLLTYEGVLTDSGGTPITTSQTVTFQVLYGSCVLFEETQSVSPGSAGEFSVMVGTGSRVDTTGNTADRIFASSGSVNCKDGSTVSMSGFATRALHIKVGSVDLSPDVTLGNIPTAINSQRLSDKVAADFLQVNAPMGATQTNIESLMSRMTDLNNLLNAYTGNTLAAQTAQSAQTAVSFTGSLSGDVSGTQGATSVDKIKGVSVDTTAPTAGQILKYVGGKWTPSADSAAAAVTSVTGTAGQITVTGTTSPILSLTNVGTAGTYTKVTVDAQGRVTTGNATLSASDIPNLDWSKITSGLPTTLAGYGITDSVKNAGSTPSIQSGLDASKPAAGIAGRIYIATDSQKIYSDSGSSWTVVGSNTGTGGTVTSVATGTGLSGGPITGSGTISLANTGVTPGTYGSTTQVGTFTVDAQGRLTATANVTVTPAWASITGVPTTLAGHGITDAISNGGSTPSIQSGTNATKPAAGTTGRLYISNDTKEIYRDNGTTWDLISSSTGSGGTITNVTAGTGLTGGGSAGSVTLNVNIGTGANQVVQLDGTAKLPAVDGSALTNLNTSNFSSLVPISKGGTGQSTATAAFSALSPLTTKGDILTYTSPNSVRLGVGTDGQVLSADSSQATGLKWITPVSGTVTNVTATSPLSVATGTTTPAISITNGGATGQSLRWNGSSWVTTKLTYTDLINSTAASPWPATTCGAGQATIWSSASDSFVCSTITISSGNFTNQSGNMIFAGPTSAGSAPPTFRSLVSADLPATGATGVFLNGGNSFGVTAILGTIDTNPLTLMTNGSSRVYITPSGAMGINTTTPNINGTPGAGTLTVAGSGGSITDTGYLELLNPIGTVSSGTSGGKITFNAAANGGSKTMGSIQTLTDGSGGASGYGGRILLQTKQDNSTTTNMVVINNLGYVGIGGGAALAPSYTLHVVGTAGLSTGTAWTNASDIRLKDIQGDYEYGLNEVLKLHTVRYHYKKDNALGLPSEHPMTGFIAQEVQKIIPDAVHTRKDGYLELNVDPIHWATVNAVQELHGMCKATEEQMKSIERRVASLEDDSKTKDERIRKLEEENASLKKDLEAIKAKLGL